MTTPKPRKKPLSRDKATLHAEIRALKSQLQSTIFALHRIRNNFDLILKGKPCRDVEETLAEVDKALANAGENT